MTSPPTPSPQPLPTSIYISDLRIENLRGLPHLHVPLDPKTVLVGENNAGKSSVLRALALFFGPHKPDDDDIFRTSSGSATQLTVDVRFRPSDGTSFSAPLRTLLGSAVQFPDPTSTTEYYAIRMVCPRAKDGNEMVRERRFLGGWANDAVGAAGLTVQGRVSTEVLELVTFFLLDARRDLVEDLRQRTSNWGRLVSDLGISSVNQAQLEAQIDTLSQSIVGSSPVLDSVRKELHDVRDALASSVAGVRLAPLPGRLEELGRAVDVLLESPGGATLPIRMQGQGARSLASVMVFQSFVKQRIGIGKTFRPLVVAAFEEPEAHLHPQAHRAMFQLIGSLDAQTVVSTHSPYVVRVADLHDIRVISRTTASTACTWVPRLAGRAPFLSTTDAIQARKFVQRNNGEVLFARLVVLVEGDTEDAALPVFARHHWKRDASALGVSFARTEGAGPGKHVARILDALAIPWILFADGDAAGRTAVAAIEGAISRTLQVGVDLFQPVTDSSFEQQLVGDGYASLVLKAGDRFLGTNAVDQYRSKNDNQAGQNGQKRDYHSTGWEERLATDFCTSHKGTFGDALAESIVALAPAESLPPVPPFIQRLFDRIDQLIS